MYVLILGIVLAGTNPAVTTETFADRLACEAAVARLEYQWQAQHWEMRGRYWWVCVPRKTEVPT